MNPNNNLAFQNMLRDNLSPEAVVAIIAFLQPAGSYRPANEEGAAALKQVAWFAETLRELVPAQERNRLMDELGL